MKSTGKMFRAFHGWRLVLFVFFTLVGPPGVAWAVSFTVNSTADAVDANPGDGICATAAGECTLRAAIMEANALAGSDTIILPAGIYTLSIPGRTGFQQPEEASKGDLDIHDDLTIVGDGEAVTIIDGGGLDRVFDIHGSFVAISGVTVRNGDPQTGDGGGIRNTGTLALTNSTVSGNRTLNSAGGIENTGTLALTNSTLSGNTANNAGGIRNRGTLTLMNSTVADNISNGVGGIWHLGGTADVIGSTISNNSAGPNGVAGGILTSFGAGPFVLTNSTVSGNGAWGGGGIWNGSASPLTLNNTTITDNTATDGTNGGGGVRSVGFDKITVRNTIIARNNAPISPDCFNPSPSLFPFGVWNSQGYNLIGDDSGCNYFAGAGDQVGTGISPIDPLLGPLADNGGPTETHALLEGSPAIDTGNPDGCTDHLGNLLTTDQRGAPRSVDGDGDGTARCDIGAFEFGLQVISVVIDIKPGSDPNSVNPRSKGVIPVAILTTDSFDATTIDPTTVLFGRTGTETAPVHFAFEDVDGNGDTDMILHFNTQPTGIQCGDTSASLTGETFSGQMIQGSDSIKTAGCK